jgi:predicted phage tail protein
MRTVKLYGELAEFTGRKEIIADIADVAESVRMLVANFAGLDRHMAEREYVVCVGDTSIGLDELKDPIGKEDILITPVIAGAGGNMGRILLGAAMVGIAFATGGAGFGIGGAAKGALGFTKASGISAFGWKAITYIGAALVFGGIAAMLAPTPKTPEKTEDPRESFNFSGITNTNAAGVPVPIVLGRTITGSVVVSAGIDTVQVDT